MNRDELVECQRAPWHPSRHADDVEPWLADDVPTFGTFQHKDTTVIFSAVDGVDRRMTAWVYLPLRESDAAKLQTTEFHSVDDLADLVDWLIQDADSVSFALADDFNIIRKGEVPIRPGVNASLVAAANEFLDNIMHTLRDRTPAETVLSARMAEASEYGAEIERQLSYA